ncbi:MAG: formyltransferase family protein [Candidatus Nitrosotenuis sp.]
MKTVVGFLSRPHGFNVLLALVKSNSHRLIRVYTHSLNPKSQDPLRTKRIDFDLFVKKCQEYNIDLISIDSKKEQIIDFPDCDYIVEVSWRYLIPREITKKARIAAFGIHRGKLPEYGGAEPIKKALLNGEKEIIISSHYLAPIIDGGSVICTKAHPVNYDKNCSMEENIQRLRDEITPLFSELTFQTFRILEK